MANTYRPVAVAVLDAASSRWSLTLSRLLPSADPAPDVLTLPAGRAVEMGWGDMNAGDSAKAVAPLRPSYCRVEVLDVSGDLLGMLFAARAAGDPPRAFVLDVLEDLDGLGLAGGPFAPATGYTAARAWTGYVQLDTLRTVANPKGSGRVLSFFAYCGLDKTVALGVEVPRESDRPASGVVNWSSVHGIFAATLYRDGDEGRGLHPRPIRYALGVRPRVPAAVNGGALPASPRWPEGLVFRFMDSADGADPLRDQTFTSDARFNMKPDAGLAVEALAGAMLAGVWQDFDGWHVASLPLVGEGSNGADALAPFLHTFAGPLPGKIVGRFTELAPAGVVAPRRLRFAPADLDGPAVLNALGPVPSLVVTSDREQAFEPETLDAENAWSLTANAGAFVEYTTGGTKVGPVPWVVVGPYREAPDGKCTIFGGTSLAQTLVNLDGGGVAPSLIDGESATSGDDVKSRAQYVGCRFFIGLGRVAGAAGSATVRLRYRLTPDDGSAVLYATDAGGWSPAVSEGVPLTYPSAAAFAPYAFAAGQHVVAAPLPKPGRLDVRFSVDGSNDECRVERLSFAATDAYGIPRAAIRSRFNLYNADGTVRPGKTATLEHGFRKLGPNLRTSDYLAPGSPQFEAWTSPDTTASAPAFPTVTYLDGFDYLGPVGNPAGGPLVVAGYDLPEAVAAWMLAAFGSLHFTVEATVRGQVLTPGDAVVLPVEMPDGTLADVECVVTASRVDLRGELSKVAAVARPRAVPPAPGP